MDHQSRINRALLAALAEYREDNPDVTDEEVMRAVQDTLTDVTPKKEEVK